MVWYQQYRTVPYHNTTFSTAGTAGMNRGYCVLYASVKDIQLCRSFYPGLRDLNSVAEILKGKIMYYCITRTLLLVQQAAVRVLHYSITVLVDLLRWIMMKINVSRSSIQSSKSSYYCTNLLLLLLLYCL